MPAGALSPYAKKDYVSHTVYDHTSILKTVEAKWNLPALTRRDANAHDVFDMLDFSAKPQFLSPPVLPDPANPAGSYSCLLTGPGQVPPPSAVTPRMRPHGGSARSIGLTIAALAGYILLVSTASPTSAQRAAKASHAPHLTPCSPSDLTATAVLTPVGNASSALAGAIAFANHSSRGRAPCGAFPKSPS